MTYLVIYEEGLSVKFIYDDNRVGDIGETHVDLI